MDEGDNFVLGVTKIAGLRPCVMKERYDTVDQLKITFTFILT